MWDLLKQADIERAKQELKLRRDEILKRHAEELKGLDNDRAEIEALDRLATEFFQKFRNATPPSEEPAGDDDAPETAAPRQSPDTHKGKAADKPAAEAKQSLQRDLPEHPTNFDVFSRAVSNSSF